MESNNNNNTTNIAIQAEEKIFDAIRNEDFTAIAHIINTNPSPGSIYMILDTLFEKLVTKSSEFCFNVLEQFINIFGIPIVLWINNPVITEVFEGLLQKDSTRTRMNDLLQLCLKMFSFNDGSNHIPNLVDLHRKANRKMPLPAFSQASSSPFSVLYHSKQKVIGDSEKITELSPERKKELPRKIEELLSTENFENQDFNFLEQDLAIHYYNELVRLLDIFENAEEEWEGVVESEQQQQVVPEPEDPVFYPKESRFRTSFFLYEKLEEDESITTEYKKYSWEFNEMIDTVLSKTICGFLNRYGGRIYIGVDDNCSVVGIKLTGKQRDEAKLHVLGLMRSFEPSNINTSHLVDIVFLPIKNPVNNQKVPGLFVMKIIVKQGDLSKLYSASKDRCQFYQRNDAQTVELKPGQVVDVLTERLLKPQKKKDESEFTDPKPETLVDFANETRPIVKKDHFRKPFEMKQQPINASGFLKKATDVSFKGKEEAVTVFIKGLPRGIVVDTAQKYLNLHLFFGKIVNKRVFHERGLTTSGEAIVTFKSQSAAQEYLTFLTDSFAERKSGISGYIKRG